MDPSGKKISFGFSKLSKKPNILIAPPKSDRSVELIDCLEGAEIKVKNAVVKVDKTPLVIPIKGNANNIVSQIERESLKNRKIKTETNDEDTRPDSELTIEELAARQLLKEARNKLTQSKDTTKVHTLPLEESEQVQDGIEPSIDDYENVPIADFGLACLRGMGWKEGMSIGKNQSKFVKPPDPEMRPKGLGLGAQKMVDTEAKDVFDKDGKKLVLAKGAFGKIVAGPHKGKFCEVQFTDEWSGRVSIKTSNTNEILTINELFVVPISKEDYILGSKVINNAKYEQYKQIEEYKEDFAKPNDESIISSEEKYSRSNGNKVKNEEEVSRHKKSRREREQMKVEYISSDDSVKIEKSSDSKYENVKNNSRGERNSKHRGYIRDVQRRSRSKEKSSRKKSSKHERNTSEESSRSSDSLDAYDGNKYDRSKSKTEKKSKSYENEKKESRQRKRRDTSEESSDKYYERKTRNRSISGSSSSEYDKYNRDKSKSYKKKDKRDSSKYSADDYERRKSSSDKRNGRKSKKNKDHEKRRDSSSELEYKSRNSKKHYGISKSEKHKSRH